MVLREQSLREALHCLVWEGKAGLGGGVFLRLKALWIDIGV